LIFLPRSCSVRHWSWYWLGPSALHAVILAWPDYMWLNYLYGVSVVFFHIGLYKKPFTNLKEYNFMKKGIIFIKCTIVCLWFFECKNNL